MRPSNHEAARRVDKKTRLPGDHVGGQHRLDDFIDYAFAERFMTHVFSVLCRQHDSVD